MGGAGRLLDRRRLLERGIYQIIYGNCLPHRFLSPWLQFKIRSVRFSCFNSTVAYRTDCIVLYCTRGGSRGRVQGVRTLPPEMTCGFLIQLVFCEKKKKKTMWFIGVEVEQETSAPPPKKNPGSAPVYFPFFNTVLFLFSQSLCA